MNIQKIHLTVPTTIIQESLEPIRSLHRVRDRGRAEPGSASKGLDPLAVGIGGVEGRDTSFSGSALVGFVEGEDGVGAAVYGVLGVGVPLGWLLT
jgi:hypothetical protein